MRALLVVLLLLAGLVLLADRVAVGVAEDQVAQQLAGKGGLVGTPEVDITGFPFLTQALARRLDEVRVSVAPVVLPSGRPLLPRRLEADRLRLEQVRQRGQFAELVYRVSPRE